MSPRPKTAPAGWRFGVVWSPAACPGCSWSPPMPTPGWSARSAKRSPGASWQRCRSHYLRNLLTKVPKSAQPAVATQVRTIFDQADAAAVHAQFDRVVTALADHYPEAAEHLEAAREELLAFTAYPRELWRQIWSNNPQERLNKEIRRRTDVVGIFPGRASLIRLVGAVLAEQHDEWTEGRRYMSLELLAKSRIRIVPAEPNPTPSTPTMTTDTLTA